MTYAQKILDERRMGFREGHDEGCAETSKEHVLALKGLLDSAVIAKQFKMPLEEVLKIWEQS